MKVDFAFSIGDSVTVKEIKRHGSIDGLGAFNDCKMYRIVYWNDGQRYSVWMYAWEIEKNGKQTPT